MSLNRRKAKKLRNNLVIRSRNPTLNKDGVSGLVPVLIRVGMNTNAKRQKI